MVEFNTDVDVPVAKQRVKDAVDKARQDLPKDLPADPNVIEVDFSEIPIMNINISGDYDLNRLKTYAEAIQDEVEQLKEITRADMVGALDREIQVNVDMYKMQAANLTFGDIERAIAYENMTISGGAVDVGNMKRALRVKGTFTNPMQLQNIAIKNSSGLPVYLKDVADVKDSFKERESYARYNGKNVITLNVIKRPIGANPHYTKRPNQLYHHWVYFSNHCVDVFYGRNQCVFCGFICPSIYLYGFYANALDWF